MSETSGEIVKLISKSTDLISYFSTAKEYYEAEIGKLRDELAQLKATLRNIPQEAWQEPALINGWVHYGGTWTTPGYFKDSFGIVHLKGLFKDGIAEVIFTLSLGYRPVERVLHVVSTEPNAAARIDVLPNGEVRMIQGNKGWISLDGITFRAA